MSRNTREKPQDERRRGHCILGGAGPDCCSWMWCACRGCNTGFLPHHMLHTDNAERAWESSGGSVRGCLPPSAAFLGGRPLRLAVGTGGLMCWACCGCDRGPACARSMEDVLGKVCLRGRPLGLGGSLMPFAVACPFAALCGSTAWLSAIAAAAASATLQPAAMVGGVQV